MRKIVARPGKTSAKRTGSILIVVDMLNGFLDPKAPLFCGKAARRIIPFVRRLVESYYRRARPVIFLADSHLPNDPEFQQFPPHCIRGSWESKVIPELRVAKGALVVPKRRFSGFFRSSLDRHLKRLKPLSVEVVGVCTNICVLYTVADLRNRGYKVKVYRKGVASFDRKAHDFALRELQSVLGAQVA